MMWWRRLALLDRQLLELRIRVDHLESVLPVIAPSGHRLHDPVEVQWPSNNGWPDLIVIDEAPPAT